MNGPPGLLGRAPLRAGKVQGQKLDQKGWRRAMVQSASERVQRKYRATQQPAQVCLGFTFSLIVFVFCRVMI